MRKQVYGRQFKRDMDQRQELFKGLMRSLALNESIKTTEAKAKSIKGKFEKLVTRSKDGDAARYHLLKHVSSDTVEKLVTEIGPRMKDRNGGYTRIIRLGTRLKDNAEMVVLELVEKGEVKVAPKKVSKKAKTAKKASVVKEAQVVKAEKKASVKPLASVKQVVTRQKKGQS